MNMKLTLFHLSVGSEGKLSETGPSAISARVWKMLTDILVIVSNTCPYATCLVSGGNLLTYGGNQIFPAFAEFYDNVPRADNVLGINFANFFPNFHFLS